MATKSISLKFADTTFRNIPLEIRFKLCIAAAKQDVQVLQDLYEGYVEGRKIKIKERFSDQIEFKRIFG